jgi:cell shape-determining protein MreC
MSRVYSFYVDSFAYARALVREHMKEGMTCAINAGSRRGVFVNVIVISPKNYIDTIPGAIHATVNNIEPADILSIETA